MSNIIQMEENMDKCVQMLMEKLAECATRTAAINISQWIQWYAFDVVGELFFSRMFGFLKGAYDHGGYIHALDLLIPLIAVACASPAYLRPLVLISGAMIPQVFKALKALKHIEDASESCVTDRQRLIESGEAGDTEDMLQSFFGIMQKKGSQKDFGITEVKMEVYGAFIAGSDTTAAAITAIVYYLMRTPSAYAKLTAEIDTASQAGLLSPIIQYHEAVGLPYLMACCKEGMRLHPSVGMTLPRQVPRGGCVVAGEWFPEGTRIGVNAAVVQQDKSIFGNDADDFVPERWLGSQAAKMERYMFQLRLKVYGYMAMADTDPSIHAGMRSTCRTIRREFNHELMKDIEQEFDNYRDYLEERHVHILTSLTDTLKMLAVEIKIHFQLLDQLPVILLPFHLITWH
ncbi:hypothetical protein CFE70_008487 [Pyrenophora teres f. teres 0-1]